MIWMVVDGKNFFSREVLMVILLVVVTSVFNINISRTLHTTVLQCCGCVCVGLQYHYFADTPHDGINNVMVVCVVVSMLYVIPYLKVNCNGKITPCFY